MTVFNHLNYPKAELKIKPSKIVDGEVGVFALRNFKKGEVIVNSKDFQDNNSMNLQEYKLLDSETKEIVKACSTITDKKVFMPPNVNLLRVVNFFNHSCEPNIGFNKNDDYIATRNIKKGEELFLDYSFLNTNPDYEIECKCGSKKI